MTYPKNPSQDALRSLAVRQTMARADYARAWDAASQRAPSVGAVYLDAEVQAAQAQLGQIMVDWEVLTGTYWADRGWRDLPKFALERKPAVDVPPEM